MRSFNDGIDTTEIDKYMELEYSNALEEMYLQMLARDRHMNEKKLKELISLIGGTIYKLMSYKDTFEAWLATKPESIQELAKAYPPGEYKVKDDAPVKITIPGKTVLLISYLEEGQLGVMVKGADKSDDALEHETMLCERYKKSKEEVNKIHKQDVTVNVDPEWIELVTNELN
jgi:hypothetical protein